MLMLRRIQYHTQTNTVRILLNTFFVVKLRGFLFKCLHDVCLTSRNYSNILQSTISNTSRSCDSSAHDMLRVVVDLVCCVARLLQLSSKLLTGDDERRQNDANNKYASNIWIDSTKVYYFQVMHTQLFMYDYNKCRGLHWGTCQLKGHFYEKQNDGAFSKENSYTESRGLLLYRRHCGKAE